MYPKTIQSRAANYPLEKEFRLKYVYVCMYMYMYVCICSLICIFCIFGLFLHFDKFLICFIICYKV